MFRIRKNFLTKEEILYLKKVSLSCLDASRFVPLDSMTDTHNKVLKEVQNFVSIPNLVGVEEWSLHADYNQLPDWHQDRDEELFSRTNKLSFPRCSCILYLDISNLKGANLEVDNTVIVPETGMLVLLESEVWHRVTPYEKGKRHSINYNFWDKPLYSS